MQTFLPYECFRLSATCLDQKRLGKQRVEAKQIINVLEKLELGEKPKWCNHPAVRMWIGYIDALKLYYNACVNEWVLRDFNNTMELYDVTENIEYPDWLQDKRLYISHRSRLMAKDPEFYSQYRWKVDTEMPYWWPVPLLGNTAKPWTEEWDKLVEDWNKYDL